MWILYVVLAVILSTGAGVFVSQNTDITTRDVARTEAPQVHGEEANRIARFLRRLYQDNPGLFPSKPGPTAAPVILSNTLVQRALVPGHRLPEGARFVLQSDGSIVPVFVPTTGPRGNLIAQTANRVVERDGSNPHLYGRMKVPNRSSTFAPVKQMAALPTATATNLGAVGVQTSGGGADALTTSKHTTVNVPGTSTGGTGGGTGGSTGGVGGVGGGGGTGGTGTGSGSSGTIVGEAEDDADTVQDVGTVKGMESLEAGGGTGGTTNTDVSSYYRSGGQAVVANGYEKWRGPTANFYSVSNIEAAISGSATLVSRMRPLLFENAASPAAKARLQAEAKFDAACTSIFNLADGNFPATMKAYENAINTFNHYNSVKTTKEQVAEDLEMIEGALMTSAMYCMGVYTGRTGANALPIRAPQAHPRNALALDLGVTIATQWKMNNPKFMTSTSVEIEYNDHGGVVYKYAAEMAGFKAMLASIQNLKAVLASYPAPLS